MNLDDRLRRSAEEITRGLATMRLPEPRRTSPILRVALAVAVGALVAGGVLMVLRPGGGDTAASTSSTPETAVTEATTTIPVDPTEGTRAATTSTTATTAPAATAPATTTPSTTGPPSPEPPTPIAGWQRVFVDDGTFGPVVITGSVSVGATTVVVACPADEAPVVGFPAWHTTDPAEWMRAIGPDGVVCLEDVVVTPHGLYAGGPHLVRSTDGGRTWHDVELTDEFGYVQALLPLGDRLTVLHQQAAENETTVATLFTTEDGNEWDTGASAILFDSSRIAGVVRGGPGLIAVGASPSGEFVPTAAAWTSPDGLSWERVTPAGFGFEEAFMAAVAATDGGYVAVGGDWGERTLMAAWSSTDGITWTRSLDPVGDTAPEHGYAQAEEITEVGGTLYAVGREFDAGIGDQDRPAVWVRDGGNWVRTDFDEVSQRLGFALTTVGDVPVGFWPPGALRGTQGEAAPVQVMVGPAPGCPDDPDEITSHDLDGDGDLDTVYIRRVEDPWAVFLGVCGTGIRGEVEVGGQATTIAGTFDVDDDALDEIFVSNTTAWGRIYQAVALIDGAPALTDVILRFGAVGDQPDGEWSAWAFSCDRELGLLSSTSYEPSGDRQLTIGFAVGLNGTTATYTEAFRGVNDRAESYSAWAEHDLCGW